MTEKTAKQCIAFAEQQCIARGSLPKVALQCKNWLDRNPTTPLLVFDIRDSTPVEIDFRGSQEDVLGRLTAGQPEAPEPEQKARGAGRPRLGVIPREVTLLPRHWEWLRKQPGGASVTLRKLVESALHTHREPELKREAQESCYRFIVAMAGNEPGFEEACRALFAGNAEKFQAHTLQWPEAIREHALSLAQASFATVAAAEA